VLQCVAVCCSVLQYLLRCVVQCVAACSPLRADEGPVLECGTVS